VTEPTARQVRFLGVPLAQYIELQSHNDAVGRDLTLLLQSGAASPLASFLGGLLDADYEHLLMVRDSFRKQVEAAREEGRTEVDLVGEFRPSDAATSQRFVRLLEEADELSLRGEILVARADPEVAHLRGWFVDETVAQIVEGREPRRYEPPSASGDDVA
jgi:hypothetical protein